MNIIPSSSFTATNYRRLFAYHKNHITYNFPDSRFRKNLFKTQIERDAKNPNASFFFAREEKTDEIIGFLWLRLENDPYKDPRPYRYLDLHYIHVDPAWRSKGVGSGLMKFVMEYAKKKKCKEIRLGTHAQNIHAQHLYGKFGFEPYRVIMRTLLS